MPNHSMKSLVAYDKIREMILTGEKLPGTRLVIAELESELGIGRGPIREAIMRLDRSGLVKNLPHKGALVARPPSMKEISIIFNTRVYLEIELTVMALKNMNQTVVDELKQLCQQMELLEPNFYRLDRRFHSTIYSASGMPHLCSIVDKLVESVEAFLTLYPMGKDACLKLTGEHLEILRALQDKDVEHARAAMERNIRSGLDIIERSYSRLM